MGIIPGNTLFVAMCIFLNLNFYVEGGVKKPPAKQPQHDYTIEFEKVEMLETPNDFLHPKTLFYTKQYNDSKTVVEADIFVVKDFPPDVMVGITLYKLNNINNQWTEKLHKENVLCDYIKDKSSVIKNIYTDGNIPKECPLPKGDYYFRNYLEDTDQFPKHMEEANMRADIMFYLKQTRIPFLSFAAYVRIVSIDDED